MYKIHYYCKLLFKYSVLHEFRVFPKITQFLCSSKFKFSSVKNNKNTFICATAKIGMEQDDLKK